MRTACRSAGTAAISVTILLLSCTAILAEDFNIEFTASYWPLDASGKIQTNSTQVDLRSDLGIRDRQSHPFFRAVFKPGSRHRINIEGIPYRLSGKNTINRTFTLGGRTYPVQDRIDSRANVDYLFGGYQFDVVNTTAGHAGIEGGVAYFGASASATSENLGTTGNEERKVGLPLAGGEFRVFPIRGKDILNVNGEVKGMSLGSYGHYIQANANAGAAIARHVRIQGGFQWVDADVHQQDLTRRFQLRFAGPILSVQLHD